MGLPLADKVLLALTAVLIAGYIGINFAADLPRFLIGENLVLAAAYAVSAYALASGKPWAHPLLLFVSAFNAGRVSRSVVTPRGELGELAVEHIPLLAVILAVSLLSLYRLVRGG